MSKSIHKPFWKQRLVGVSNRPPDTFEKYRDAPPISVAILSAKVCPPSGRNRRVLHAAHRGAQFYFMFPVLWTFSSCNKMSLFHLKTCTPVKGTPLKQSLNKVVCASPICITVPLYCDTFVEVLVPGVVGTPPSLARPVTSGPSYH